MERCALHRTAKTLAGRASCVEAAPSNAEIVHCKYGDGQKKVTATVKKGSGADGRKCKRDPGKNPEKTQPK